VSFLNFCAGDTFQSLILPRPINIGDNPSVDVNTKASMNDFQRALGTFQKDSRDVRTSRQSALEFTQAVELALTEIQNEYGEGE